MEARVRSAGWRCLRRAPAVVPLLLALPACGDDPSSPGPPARDAASVVATILRTTSGGRTDLLDGAVLAWRETLAGKTESRREVLAALRRPDKLRLEIHDGSETVVCKVVGTDHWVGPAAGPFIRARPERVAETRRLFLLLGSLLAWDLRAPTRPGLQNGALQSKADWAAVWAGAEPVVERALDRQGEVTDIRIGDQTYRLGGRFAGAVGSLRNVCATANAPGMEFTRFEPGAVLEEGYFRPTAAAQNNVIEYGGETHYFANPQLVSIPASHELEVEDPGDWTQRFRLLDELGRALFDLGQDSAGLPAYTRDGKLVVFFTPRDGRAARVPDGHSYRRRRRRHALVLSARAPFLDAARSLEERLLAHARKVGLEAASAVRLRAYRLPGVDETPTTDTVLLVRGELEVR